MKKSKKGFTLIELLVVITIIGILVTLIIVNMGSAIDNTKITKVTSTLREFNRALAEKGKGNMPQKDDLSEPTTAGFAAFVWDQWNWEDRDFWYMEDAQDVLDLKDDGEDGLPEYLGDGSGDVDTDVTAAQKKAMSWEVAVPKTGAPGNLEKAKRNRGSKFPIMWTKGLDSDGNWDGKSPWSGAGGHILWSNGSYKWYEDTAGDDEKGIFKDDAGNRTKDITKAIPDDWEILEP